ncbi:MAG: hypothetical protein HPY81_09235 [Firmicutes bacterium]|nr:hypothetical protein [Bacillota bacterium]
MEKQAFYRCPCGNSTRFTLTKTNSMSIVQDPLGKVTKEGEWVEGPLKIICERCKKELTPQQAVKCFEEWEYTSRGKGFVCYPSKWNDKGIITEFIALREGRRFPIKVDVRFGKIYLKSDVKLAPFEEVEIYDSIN